MKPSLAAIIKHLPTVASVCVGVVPLFVLIYWFGVPRKLILGWGILSYLVGVAVFKMPLYHFVVVKVLHKKLSNVWLGISQGVGSAVSELGSALLFFRFVVPQLSLAELIGFGAAAGAVEAIVLPFIGNPLAGTPLERPLPLKLSSEPPRSHLCNGWVCLSEDWHSSCTLQLVA